jgi:hypothetical protein
LLNDLLVIAEEFQGTLLTKDGHGTLVFPLTKMVSKSAFVQIYPLVKVASNGSAFTTVALVDLKM